MDYEYIRIFSRLHLFRYSVYTLHTINKSSSECLMDLKNPGETTENCQIRISLITWISNFIAVILHLRFCSHWTIIENIKFYLSRYIQFNSDICTRQLMNITLARTAEKKAIDNNKVHEWKTEKQINQLWKSEIGVKRESGITQVHRERVPPLANKMFFWHLKKWKTRFAPPPWVSTSGQQKFGPTFWNPYNTPMIITVVR